MSELSQKPVIASPSATSPKFDFLKERDLALDDMRAAYNWAMAGEQARAAEFGICAAERMAEIIDRAL